MQTPEVPAQHPVQPVTHAAVLQASTSTTPPHATPVPHPATSTPRLRIRVPPPQLAEQLPHAPHSDITQSAPVHAASLQLRASSVEGHPAPPLAACRVTVRLRVWLPPPHGSEHWLQSLHCATAQSTLHTEDLVCVSWVGHGVPPLAEGVMTALLRVCCVLPTTQADQAPHCEATQSTGVPVQACWLQATTSCKTGHALPPFSGATMTVLVRLFCPPPQSASQPVQSPQSLTTQLTSTAHAGRVSHDWCCTRAGQAAPP